MLSPGFFCVQICFPTFYESEEINLPSKNLSPKIPLKYTKLLYKYKEKSKNLHNSLLSPLYFAILLNIKLLGGRIWKVKLVRKNWLIGF